MYIMYLRKSRADDSSMTVQEVLERHETILQEYAEKTFGYKIPEQNIYREIVSGETIQDRPEMQKVLEFITNNDVTGVLVVEPQRLSRGDLVDCGTICRVFKYSNTKIITPKWAYDLQDERDYKFFESELRQGNDFLNYIIGIMVRGRLASVKSGQYIANKALYGYDKVIIDGKKTLTPNDNAPVVKTIYDLCLKGLSPYHIGKELDRQGIKPSYADEWSQKSIVKILTNIHYTGKIKYQERKTTRIVDASGNIEKKRPLAEPMIFDGLHPAIIDEQTFKDVQETIGRNTRKPNGKRFASPYATLVKCGICGKSVTLQSYGGKKPARMVCRNKHNCGNRSISYVDFQELVINALKAEISDFEVLVTNDTTESENPLIKVIQNDLLNVEKRIQKIYYAYENGIYTDNDFIEQKTKAEQERDKLEQALTEAKENKKTKEQFKEFTLSLHSAIDSLRNDNISAESKNRLLKSILKKIEFTRTGEEPSVKLYL